EPPDIGDLGQILDIDALVWQLGADRGEIFALRTERFLEPRLGLRLQLIELALPRRPLMRAKRTIEGGERRLRIGHDADRRADNPVDLDRIEIDPDHLDLAVETPARLRLVKARADREHDIGAAPQLVPGEQVLRQVMPVAEDALAAGI